ncbi:hypothetical protein BTW32_26135 [Bacillus thuringiensis]|nr:hypothetical protein BTW32_26135 [Bacillus thuringiensis]
MEVWAVSKSDSTKKTRVAHYNNKETLVASISSNPSPSPGQKNRSSQNFSIDNLPAGTKGLKWVVEPTTPDSASNIRFKIMRDVSGGTDPVVWSDLFNQKTTGIQTSSKFYVSNPQGASKNFTVKVYAISN